MSRYKRRLHDHVTQDKCIGCCQSPVRHIGYQSFHKSAFMEVSLLYSVLLGVTDAVVETMFRTPEGFLTPLTNWLDSEPVDARNTPVEDCIIRQVGGLWEDLECSLNWNFYCEGECSLDT